MRGIAKRIKPKISLRPLLYKLTKLGLKRVEQIHPLSDRLNGLNSRSDGHDTRPNGSGRAHIQGTLSTIIEFSRIGIQKLNVLQIVFKLVWYRS